MKVKELLLLASLMAFAGSASAVNEFEVTAPQWKQLVVSTSDEGVNIRKLPSTTAPKLVYDEYKVDNFQSPLSWFGYWSSKPTGGSISAVKFNGPNILVGEKDGWYEVKNIGPKCASNGWVSAKFCKTVTPTPLSSESTAYSEFIKWISKGADQYNGAYGLYSMANEMEGEAMFYLGRLSEGKLICPYSFYANLIEDSDHNMYKLTYDSDSGYTLYCPEDMVNLNNINSEIISIILDKMKISEDGYVLVVCDLDGYLETFPY